MLFKHTLLLSFTHLHGYEKTNYHVPFHVHIYIKTI